MPAPPCSRTCSWPRALGCLEGAWADGPARPSAGGRAAAAVMPKLLSSGSAGPPAALSGLAGARWTARTRGQRPGAMGLPRRRSLATSHPGRRPQPAPDPLATHNPLAAPIRALRRSLQQG